MVNNSVLVAVAVKGLNYENRKDVSAIRGKLRLNCFQDYMKIVNTNSWKTAFPASFLTPDNSI